jgi:hypothetical protein
MNVGTQKVLFGIMLEANNNCVKNECRDSKGTVRDNA